MKYPHLHKKTATYLDADTEERIWHIRLPHWIGYPQAGHILNKLEDLRPLQNSFPSQQPKPKHRFSGEGLFCKGLNLCYCKGLGW